MQWISNLLSPDNRTFLIVAIALAFAIVYRVAFAHRLRVPGGSRTRQPRLGLVDAFSLDGQRQLVLVRRDNIEHLIMIGGPNDVLVESQIIRAAASPLARERDVASGKTSPARAPAVAIEAPPAPSEPALQPPRAETPAVKPPEPPAPVPARPAFRASSPVNVSPTIAAPKSEPPMGKPEPTVVKPEP